MLLKLFYRYLQKHKEKNLPLYPGTRELEKRSYLTLDGIKNYNELTLKDKLQLNIKIK